MTISRRISRPMLAAMFVAGGLDSVRKPETKAPAAEKMPGPLVRSLPLPKDPVVLVQTNGGIQVAGGLLLGFGKLPRLAALALAASLVPTTLAGHQFWLETDPKQRRAQRIHFLKNVSILGGLLLAATDTEGRPSLSWRAHRAAERARKSLPGGD